MFPIWLAFNKYSVTVKIVIVITTLLRWYLISLTAKESLSTFYRRQNRCSEMCMSLLLERESVK